MSKPIRFDPEDREIIDIGPRKRGPWRRLRWLILAAVVLLFAASRGLSIYLSALWFASLGYVSVYWYIFKLKLGLFLVFAVLTTLILRGGFWLLERAFASYAAARRTIFINQQPVNISPARFIRPIAWIVAIIAGLVFGFSMRENWRRFALYANQAPTEVADPVFHKPLAFYLFTLPVYDLVSSWLLVIAFIILCGAIIHALLAITQQAGSGAARDVARKRGLAAVSFCLAAYLVVFAWRFFLSRYPYLWEDHELFSGVNYMEDHFLLPGLALVSLGLLAAAAIALLNAFTRQRLRLLLFAVAIPVAVFIVAIVLVPAYVTNFIVKPNELGRESDYIRYNLQGTRRAFGVDKIESRPFDTENSVEAFDLQNNRATLDNIRLWDWRALKDTLTQIQAIRTYYDFTDVDVDRYRIGDQERQMMLAPREIDIAKLPESSRNWINEALIYTHGFGLTMNTANGFDAEGMPKFVLWNMPIESSAPDIRVTRPEIYFGQKTDTDVYVQTTQREFNFPQGETNNLTTYEGEAGIRIGNAFRRLVLAAALGDLTKLPFSDDVTADSRVLIHRNIRDFVNSLAPFLVYDNDPYMVVSREGRLFWIIDAFTESADYPYSRHYNAGGKEVNYIRNSVKVVIDAYNGAPQFYVFDSQDPLIRTYRATFPSLFRDASEMPADLRAHIRYPETLIKTQGEAYGLYHIQDTKVFFQREDAWDVANQVSSNEQNQAQTAPIEPFFVLMQLPGEKAPNEFVEILPFTPHNRNNMIGWMAGRCDGEAYGTLLVYNFPKSRLIDGPLQIEARIDQNAQLSGQFTLWNQQGSHVQRGHLLVIPIGRSLLYVEPVYLKAERSAMPELRLVVLATQDRLAYGSNFDEAMTNLFGEAGKAPLEAKAEQPKSKGAEAAPQPSSSPAVTQSTQQLINRAIQEFDEYQRLTAEGKLAEAGKKLEEHKRTLEELRKAPSKP